jgi:hypothetical protein
MLKEHLITVMNLSSKGSTRIDDSYVRKSIIEDAQKLEDMGMSASNIEIRFSQKSKKHDNRYGKQTRMSYNDYIEYSNAKRGNKGGGRRGRGGRN